jgi:hypothetical protein
VRTIILITLLVGVAQIAAGAPKNLRIVDDETYNYYISSMPELSADLLKYRVAEDGNHGGAWVFVGAKGLYYLEDFPKRLSQAIYFAEIADVSIAEDQYVDISVKPGSRKNPDSSGWRRVKDGARFRIQTAGIQKVAGSPGNYDILKQDFLIPGKWKRAHRPEYARLLVDIIRTGIESAPAQADVGTAGQGQQVEVGQANVIPPVDLEQRLARLKKLHEQGLLTQEQFDRAVAEALK